MAQMLPADFIMHASLQHIHKSTYTYALASAFRIRRHGLEQLIIDSAPKPLQSDDETCLCCQCERVIEILAHRRVHLQIAHLVKSLQKVNV